ncbi:putative porin [Shewanella marinintestina]|uniref:putative porin n=1 Tax=Shewanella marinintestina TaxID=190305 RepID=UPI00200D03B9|nr:putative porin [Shewanella marinintestina]MCL1146658.1 putative porin [Shewanella marinintestina]
MRQTTTALAILLSLTSLSAVAAQDNNYQHEAGLSYTTNSEEVSDGLWNANYRYYFESVEQSKAPYALNGFLAQESNIGANYQNFDPADSDSYGVDGTFVLGSNWFVGANYQKFDVASYDFNTYGAEVGYYFNDSSAVSAFYQDGDDNFTETYGLKVRSYIALQSTAGIDLNASWAHNEFDDVLNVGADWYINNAWSVGAGYTDSDNDDAFDVRTAYWLRITDGISANFQISKVLDSDYDGVGLGLGLVGRF